jgi:nucleotide-binding universal stress UspA family protein
MKVLCALDGSKHSRWVVEALRRWNFPQGSGLMLLHVVDTAKFRLPKTAGGAAQGAMKRARTMAEEIGRGLLERMKAALRSVWSVVENRIVRGHPAEAIVQAAVREKADLIVMGSRGLTDVRAFLLGSVSRKVVMHADCPVLLIKKHVPVLRRIVVATEGSKDAKAALDFLLQMPVPEAACFTVVSVVPPLPIDAIEEPLTLAGFLEQLRVPLNQKAKAAAKQAVERLEKAGFEARTAVVHGHPSHEIVKVAEAERADLIVVGSRGLTGTVRFLMGSVSDGVIKYAPCAVLVFRRQGD